jgi:CBS domain-containing protein
MAKSAKTETAPRLVLSAETAAELMTPNPVSIRDTATIAEAVSLLTDKGISGAPVIDDAGRPIGVLSRGDIVAYDRERAVHPTSSAAEEAQAGTISPRQVRDLMTPAVFSVAPETPASKVVGEMLALQVHRLFVVDKSGVLVGVISAPDVLRHLQPEV